MRFLKSFPLVMGLAAFLSISTQAAEITIPNSALIPSGTLYTNSIGSVVGIGDPSGHSDDGFSGPIDLGFTLNFFGASYTQFWINNNGNVSFGDGISDYNPSGPTGASQPIISPFFADVDTRGAGSGVVYLSQLPNEDIITWSNVGYYDSEDGKLDNFQLVLRGPGYSVPAGEGQIGFFYTNMQWEAGDASGGRGGFCSPDAVCYPAAVGFGDGLGNGEVLESSLQPGISGVVNDTHIWFDLNSDGVPVTTDPSSVPEPSTYALLSAGILGLYGFAAKRRSKSQS